MRNDLMAQAALTYHKTVEGEYGCPGLECPGVKRLITFGQECAALTAQGEIAPAPVDEQPVRRCGRVFGTASIPKAVAPFHCTRRAGHEGGCGWGEPYKAAASPVPAAEGRTQADADAAMFDAAGHTSWRADDEPAPVVAEGLDVEALAELAAKASAVAARYSADDGTPLYVEVNVGMTPRQVAALRAVADAPAAASAVPAGLDVETLAREWMAHQIADAGDDLLDSGDCRCCGHPAGEGHERTDPCGIITALLAALRAVAEARR